MIKRNARNGVSLNDEVKETINKCVYVCERSAYKRIIAIENETKRRILYNMVIEEKHN